MKKIIFNIILNAMILFIFNLSYGQRLNGNVKSYKDSYFSAHEIFGKIKKGSTLHDSTFHDAYVVLDKDGNISSVMEYNPDGSVHCKYKSRNDYKNNWIESVFVRFDPVAIIDSKPYLIESVKNSHGDMCEMAYKNDSSGLPVEEVIFDITGRELIKIMIVRDEKGNPLEYNFSDGASCKMRYNSQGNRIERNFTASNRSFLISLYKYDTHGNLIQEDIKDSFKSYYNFHVEHNTFFYRYDEYGNWIERIDYEHDIPQRVVLRTIEYAK